MRALERYLLLQIIDQRWREHLYDMDYLREGIHLRGFAQIEPIIAYKNEAFTLFTDLMNSIWSDFARMVFHVEVEVEVEDPAAIAVRRRRARQPDAVRLGHATRAAAAARRRGARRGRGGRRRSTSTAYGDEEPMEVAPRVEQRVARRGRADRPQRPVLVRLGQEVQEVPRRVGLGARSRVLRWRPARGSRGA